MKRPLVFLFLFFILCSVAQAEDSPPSLFFTAEEQNQIDEAFQKTDARNSLHANETIRLDAILYYAPDRWTFWLQDERWTPDTTNSSIRVRAVSPTQVDFKITTPHGPKDVTLKPHQTYDLVTGKIAEGTTLEPR